MFNIAKASANARKDLNNKKVGAIVLGPSGAGKSSLLGTFGCKTLFLYTGGEVHGPTAAATYGKGDVVAVRFDQDDEGNQLSADDSYARLLGILDSWESLKEAGIGAIVIDSMTEVEFIVRSTTKFAKDCLTDKGKHDGWAEPKVTLNMFRPILVKLRDLQLNIDIHYAVTCLLTVSAIADNGEIEESSPKLLGYQVADGFIPQFPDILVVGRMVGKSGVPARRIQFNAGVTKVSKDTTGAVKKMINFDPRITGVEKLPTHMEASLAKVVELKQGEAK